MKQHEGDGDKVRVLQRIKDREPTLLWELDESYVGEDPKWIKGQIQIHSEETPGFEYRVNIISEVKTTITKNILLKGRVASTQRK